MRSIEGAVTDFRQLDLLANGGTALHRLDARAKVLVTLFFILAVVSFDRYALAPLFPFFLYPVVLVSAGNLPAGFIARKVGMVVPFAVVVGLFNPIFDREIISQLGPFAISGGMVSFASIIVRTVLTVGAAVCLVGLTGFLGICQALERLGMPRVFTVQLLFLYRYIFVLAEEASRAARARELRAFGRKGRGLAGFGSLVGHLLVRTWLRAERIHMAMLARGFRGEFHTRKVSGFGGRELGYLLIWAAIFLLLRISDPSRLLGGLVMGHVS
ncbi:cobalt ECF transporter T component CbiQ [Thiovibrio sp. JS02]